MLSGADVDSELRRVYAEIDELRRELGIPKPMQSSPALSTPASSSNNSAYSHKLLHHNRQHGEKCRDRHAATWATTPSSSGSSIGLSGGLLRQVSGFDGIRSVAIGPPQCSVVVTEMSSNDRKHEPERDTESLAARLSKSTWGSRTQTEVRICFLPPTTDAS